MSQRWWKPLLQKAAELAKKDGVTFPAHLGMYALRHTSHEIMSISGIEAALIAKLMGHTRVTTTYANYDKPSEERMRAAADRIQAFFTGTDGG